MSSTKPELHDVLHYRQRRTLPLPSATCVENFVQFGRGFPDMQAGRQTDTLIAIPRTPPGGEVIVLSHSYKDNAYTHVTAARILETFSRNIST